MACCACLLLLMPTILTASGSALCINEFCAKNVAQYVDSHFGEYEDWIEIYNRADTALDLGGYYLSDDLKQADKWRIPEGNVIMPGGYALFWADGRDVYNHTNFKLAQRGGEIGLFTAALHPVDTLRYGPQRRDVSYGRAGDGGTDWHFFVAASPWQANGSDGRSAFLPPSTMSPAGGFYGKPQRVELRTRPGAALYYTLDGTEADSNAQLYTQAINIRQTTVVRARAYHRDFWPSDETVQSFFINESSSLPVVSIAVTPSMLWDHSYGMYANYTANIEHPVHLEWYQADGSLGFQQRLGMAIHGHRSRINAQKSFALYARSRYGDNRIRFPLFRQKPIKKFKNFILRNSGGDWSQSMIGDAFQHNLLPGISSLDYQAYTPVVLYLNGRYWGVINAREKINKHYLAQNHGVDPDSVDIIGHDMEPLAGTTRHWHKLLDLLETADLADGEAYRQAAAMIDINSFVDYAAFQIYVGNTDWPFNNFKMWRLQQDEARWRCFVFDLDAGFSHARFDDPLYGSVQDDYRHDSFDWAQNPAIPNTIFLRQLLRNENFRRSFVQRMASHLNFSFAPPRVIAVIDRLQSLIAPEMDRHIARWAPAGGIASRQAWDSVINLKRRFARERPAYIRQHLERHFGLPAAVKLTVAVAGGKGGVLLVDDIPIGRGAEEALFYPGYAISLRAVPDSGYVFASWSDPALPSNPAITLHLEDDYRLSAGFLALE